MGLFDLIGGIFKSEKSRLEEILERDPRPKPDVFYKLIKIYREDGDEQKAMRIAKRGAALYPDAIDITRAQNDLARLERDLEKERLRQKIDSYPNPILYGRLAELYKADGEVERSVKVCEKGIKDFPEYGGTHLVLAQITFDNQDLEAARTHLERAVELDKYSYLGLKLLADCYMRLNLHQEAIEQLKSILEFAPGDEVVLQMLKQCQEVVGEPVTEPRRSAPAPRAASRKAAPTKSTRGKAAKHRERVLNDSLESFVGVSGVTGAIVVDPYGLVVASQLPDGQEEDLVGALVTNVYRTTVHSAEQMQIGQFEEGLIEGADANVHIISVHDMILAVFAESSVKMGMLQKAINDFVMAAQEVS